MNFYNVTPAYLLKEIASQLAPSLTLVFKASLNQSKLPSDWKTTHIVPAHKRGTDHYLITTGQYL